MEIRSIEVVLCVVDTCPKCNKPKAESVKIKKYKKQRNPYLATDIIINYQDDNISSYIKLELGAYEK